MNSDDKIDGYIEEYKEWIEKNIPVGGEWIDELNYLSFLRSEIHNYITRKGDQFPEIEEIRSLDKKWQRQIEDTLDASFNYTDKPAKVYPKEEWWWHIDKLQQLTDLEKSSL